MFRSRLLAVAVLLVMTGCATTPLFSRKDDDDAPLDARSGHDRSLGDAEAEQALNGQWNVVRDANQPPDVATPARPPITLPVSELLGRAEQALAQQNLPEARRHLEALLRQQPSHPRAHHLLAYISDVEGMWGDAEHHYQLALQSDPHNSDIVHDLGYSYLLQGRLPLAEQYLLQARQLNPSHLKAATNLAELYSRRNDMQSAYRVLSDVLPPAEVEQSLAQLFPGAPLHATMNPETGPAPQYVADGQRFPDEMPRLPPDSPGATNPAEHANPVLVAPGFTSSMPIMPAPTNPMPNDLAYIEPYARGQPAVVAPYQQPQTVPSAPPQATIGQVVADGAVAHRTASNPIPSAPSAGPRRWPPAFWPPESGESPVTQAAGVSTPSPQSSTSGVTYLLPRRAQATPTVTPFAPGGAPPANAAPPAFSNPPRPLPQGTVSQFENPAEYATGPGDSRIVTWSNLNGQSVENPPLPPTEEELRAAASMGLNGGAAPPTAVLRTSPGSASGWNGGFYPPPQRQLPGSSGSVYDYPQQGAPLRAAAPGSSAAATSANEPHAGFVIAPNNALPANPLAGFEADRRQFDQQYQQQVDQSYARSPSGYIRPPSESIPAPTYEIPAQTPPALSGPPLTPNGTPWPGRSANGSVPPSNAPGSVTGARLPAASGLVTPLPYQSRQTAAPPVTPPAYNRPASSAQAVDAYSTGGPRIVPGPNSW